MAEFGENLKNVREQKGYTQQTLADHLYVTRQAVSRWEGGSRYPDLMTAKKMAQFLEVSLDDLLTDDDMKLYAEKNAIIENPIAKRGQLILLALAFMSTLLTCITLITPLFFIEDNLVYLLLFLNNGPVNIITAILLGITLVCGLIDRLNAKTTLVLYSCYFGVPVLYNIISQMILPLFGYESYTEYSPMHLISRVLQILLIVFCIRFFASKRNTNPMPIYILCAVMEAFAFISILTTLFSKGEFLYLPYTTITLVYFFSSLTVLLMLALLPIMVHVLYKKRKLSVK